MPLLWLSWDPVLRCSGSRIVLSFQTATSRSELVLTFPYLAVIDRFRSNATILGRPSEHRRVFVQAGNIRRFGNARKSVGFSRYGVEAADNAAPCEYFPWRRASRRVYVPDSTARRSVSSSETELSIINLHGVARRSGPSIIAKRGERRATSDRRLERSEWNAMELAGCRNATRFTTLISPNHLISRFCQAAEFSLDAREGLKGWDSDTD